MRQGTVLRDETENRPLSHPWLVLYGVVFLSRAVCKRMKGRLLSMNKKRRISKISKPFLFTVAVSVMLPGIAPFTVTNVQADSVPVIDYGDGENYEGGDLTPVISEGDIKALVVRLGYEDYPIDAGNEYYISDDSFQILFNGYEEGELKEFYKDHPYGCVNDFVRRTSYGRQSLTLGSVIDIVMDDTQQSYYDRTDYGSYGDLEEVVYIIGSEEFKKKLFEQINVSDYDSNGDGEIDALYIFDMAPDAGIENNFNGFYDDGYDQTDDALRYMYFPAELTGDPHFTEVVIHETGHMLWNLPDLYNFSGFLPETSVNTAGNLMGTPNNEAGDIDAFSKYHIGWITEDNITRLDINDIMESDRTISLEPYDGDALEGKVLAVIDCGEDYSIAIEYAGGSNNNRSPLLDKSPCGFRFYQILKSGGAGDICQIYETQKTNIFAEGEEIYNLFGDYIDVTDISTQGTPSLKLSSGRKSLVKRAVKSKSVIESDEDDFFLGAFEYSDNNVAIMVRNDNSKVKIGVIENGNIVKEYQVDLSGITDAHIYKATVLNLDDGTFALIINADRADFFVKMDKEGNIVSDAAWLPGEYIDHVVIGNRLLLFSITDSIHQHVTVFDLDDLSDVSEEYIDKFKYGYRGGGMAGMDYSYLIDPGSYNGKCIIYDKNGNKTAVLENDFGNNAFVVCVDGDGFVSVRQREKEGYFDFEMIKYDSEGQKLSSEILKEVKKDAGEEDTVFKDVGSYMSVPNSDDSIQKTEWGWFMIMSGDCYFIYDNGEMEYFGEGSFEKGHWPKDSVYLANGTAVFAADYNEDIVIYEIADPDNSYDPSNVTEDPGATGAPTDDSNFEGTESHENSEDNKVNKDNKEVDADHETGEISGSEESDDSINKASADDVSVTVPPVPDEEKEPGSDISPDITGSKVSVSRGDAVVKASGSGTVKNTVAPVTGDRDLTAVYITTASISLIGLAGLITAFAIRKKRS